MSIRTSVFALVASMMVLAMLSAFPVYIVNATDGGINLPSAMVTIEVINGTDSYFNTSLSGIPSGYDVVNGTYPGWCVDITSLMARSPAIHEVTLYSSINPPGTLANESWDMVNYVLNHKNGTASDIQQAIWYFVHMDANYTPSTNGAWAMVNDTLLNGHGFVPENGEATAVICLPKILLPSPNSVQISIIEIAFPPIPEFPAPTVSLFIISIVLLALIVYKRRTPTVHG
jgi:hypothetical protein